MSDTREFRLEDYRPPSHGASNVRLHLDVHGANHVVVTSDVVYESTDGSAELRLDGDPATLESVSVDGAEVPAGRRTLEGTTLVLADLPRRFELRVVTRLDPAANTSLSGLYASGGMLCTQCEAEGFRKITFFLDRPDVLAVYRTTIDADPAVYPVLLANGNRIATSDLPDGRRRVVWEDPFKKPSYLFACVAGDLGRVDGSFTTMSGRDVALEVWVDRGDEDRAGHALECLRRAMAWDEKVYGREYDLDLYMIVAVRDFNFGAMENKGLNIFNSALVLARPDTATDSDYETIEAVIGHEYFHNWSGNRVTLRDWFQLSLKEGFTVLREHDFCEAVHSRDVERINQVRGLRAHQFPEDAGPMAHPVRPPTYRKIDNFYTSTVYEKGAEVIRMMRTMIGAEAFRAGCDHYFDTHDGSAATTEDFVRSLEAASGHDLSAFERCWYRRAGTPVVDVREQWDEAAGEFTLELAQAGTTADSGAAPFVIPMTFGLLGGDGTDLPLAMEDDPAAPHERTVVCERARTEVTVTGLKHRPVASLFRGFSAPIHVRHHTTDRDLSFRLAHDRDGFNRWDAGQQLATGHMLTQVARRASGESIAIDDGFLDALSAVVRDRSLDAAVAAEVLVLPSEVHLGQQLDVMDVDGVHEVRIAFRRALARATRPELMERYRELAQDDFATDTAARGRRRLKNVFLSYLAALGDDETRELARGQQASAENMTDELSALVTLVDLDAATRADALSRFHDRWKDEALVMDKWLAIQAGASHDAVLDEVRALLAHPAHDPANPNSVRALLGSFSRNLVAFHDVSGDSYRFVADRVLEIDGRNPQLSSRLATCFSSWKRYDAARQAAMRVELERLRAAGPSANLAEIVSKSLEG